MVLSVHCGDDGIVTVVALAVLLMLSLMWLVVTSLVTVRLKFVVM